MSGDGPTTPAESLDRTLGLEGFEREGDGVARATLPVTDRSSSRRNRPWRAYATLAESLASRATYGAVRPESIAMVQSNNTTSSASARGPFTRFAGPQPADTWIWMSTYRERAASALSRGRPSPSAAGSVL